MNINFWTLLFNSGLVIGIFIMLIFLLFRKKYSLHVQNLTVILFLFSLMLISEIADELGLSVKYPFIINYSITIELLLWPFLIFYFQYMTKSRMNYRLTDLKYFSPFVIGLAWQLYIMYITDDAKLAHSPKGISEDIAFFVFYKAIIAIAFLIQIFVLLNKRATVIKSISNVNKQFQLIKDSRKLIVVFSMIILITYALFFLNYFNIFLLGDSDQIGSLLITLSIYVFGILAFKNPVLLEKENYSKSITDYMRGNEEHYIKLLLAFFNEKKPYLDEKLALRDVASKIGLSNQQLSYLINRQLGLTFLDFVNSYRVKAVQEHIRKEKHLHSTLLDIAFDSGFNSKASFNRIFKNQIGVSPSNYVKTLKIKGSI